MSDDDINDYFPSILNPRAIKRNTGLSLTQISSASCYSLSLKCKEQIEKKTINKIVQLKNKENLNTEKNSISITKNKNVADKRSEEEINSDVKDLNSFKSDKSSFLSFSTLDLKVCKKVINDNSNSLILVQEEPSICSDTTLIYEDYDKPIVSVSFSANNCDNILISSKYSYIKKISVDCKDSEANIDCVIIEGSQRSEESKTTSDMNKFSSVLTPPKRKSVSVNLEIKKQKLTYTEDTEENPKVLILNTNAIEKLSHVIVQPPNYKLVKRKVCDKLKRTKEKAVFGSYIKNEQSFSDNLKQKSIDTYFKSSNGLKPIAAKRILQKNDVRISVSHAINVVRDDAQEMSKNLGNAELKFETGHSSHKERRNEIAKSPRLAMSHSVSPKRDIKASISEVPSGLSPRNKKDSIGSYSPRKNGDALQFHLPLKSKSNKTSIVNRNIPHFKIVAGTHFAVDAFSYGDIPNVKHYFLTHFHSDHYSGLKKNFSKLLFCSQITADLCISRLGVSSKCIHVINIDETIRIEGVEVTAVDANHCPGAVMLVFTLPNGKTLLHTGDFRGCPTMESYPVFWNKDVHTIYLDTTYCNPRYDFPTQDQSLEMALYILRQKKASLEKAGKQFSTVLIVCGTYTIGKEKFFLGLSRRVGCSVWACPEKDRVLQAVERRSFSHAPPASCQLHVVPMRDLVHEVPDQRLEDPLAIILTDLFDEAVYEMKSICVLCKKLHTYLESLGGSFNEVVAFKPSGWENGRNSSVQKDSVTIHGIPYSEHSSFSELIRFVKFLKPKQVVPTVDISGGVKSVQKYFPCPLVNKEELQCQSRLTDYFPHGRPVAVT